MTIVMGLDQHREQITFDALDVATGEVSRGRIRPADREGVRRWLARWQGREIEAALDGSDRQPNGPLLVARIATASRLRR